MANWIINWRCDDFQAPCIEVLFENEEMRAEVN